MGLFSQIKGFAGKLGGNRGARAYIATLGITDLWASAYGDVSLVTGEYRNLGAGYTVPPKQQILWGAGVPSQPDNQGYAYLSVRNTSDVQIEGTVRFVIYDAGKYNETVVDEVRTERLSASQTDRRIMYPMPAHGERAAVQDEILMLRMMPDANATADQNATSGKAILPITRVVIA